MRACTPLTVALAVLCAVACVLPHAHAVTVSTATATRLRTRSRQTVAMAVPDPDGVLAHCRDEFLNIPGVPSSLRACKPHEHPCLPANHGFPLPPGMKVPSCPQDNAAEDDQEGPAQTRASPVQQKTKQTQQSAPVPKPQASTNTHTTQANASTTNTTNQTVNANKPQPQPEPQQESRVMDEVGTITYSEVPRLGAPQQHVPAAPRLLNAANTAHVAQKCVPTTGATIGEDLRTDEAQQIIKSYSDKRDYRRFQLANGLDVLLISDNTTTKSAAAVDVNAGFWKDPADIPGLAHFLEHMLFLGSKKFPKEDSYNAFLSAHGGSSNAFTSMSNTNFYFDVEPTALEPALDRFAQFFISPTLTESATSREMRAVNAEHVKNLQSDSWRLYQMLQSLANPSHPFHKFGTGNLQTLGSVPPSKLRQALIAHWKKYYIAPNLRLVVLGKEPIEKLEAWARKYFHAVPTGPVSALTTAAAGANTSNASSSSSSSGEGVDPNPVWYCDTSSQVYPSDLRPSMIYSQSVQDSRSLLLVWTLPPQTPHYKEKNMEYLSILLGNEAKGSLLSVLKAQGLATALSAGCDLSTPGFDLFQISIDLTKKGMQKHSVQDIVVQTMRYLQLLEARGVQDWRWKEMGTISAIRFRLKNKSPAQNYVSTVAGGMGKYSHKDLLVGSYIYDKFNPQGIKALLRQLTPETMLVVLSAQHLDVPLTRTEPFYGSKFEVQPFEQAGADAFHNARTEILPDQRELPPTQRMALPGRNQFIPTSLKIKKGGKLVQPVGGNSTAVDPSMALPQYNMTEVDSPPYIVLDVVDTQNIRTGSLRVWFKQDTTFKRPRSNVVCKLWSQQIYSAPRDVVMASLYTKVVRDVLGELEYAATTAGFTFSLTSDVDGFDLRLSGYDSGMLKYVQHIAKYFMLVEANRPDLKAQKGFEPNPARFLVLKEELAQSYINFNFGQPHTQASYGVSMLLEQPHWHISEYLSALRDITLEDVVSWSRGVYQDMAIECLVHGNMLESEAVAVVKALAQGVDYSSSSTAYRSVSSQRQRVVQLDGAYTFQLPGPNVHDQNSVAYVYYQYEGQGNILDDLLMQLLARVMEKPCFHQLRTVEQLGYIVWSGLDVREGVNGIRVIVQSPKRTARYLHSRILAFMTKLREHVRSMSQTKFKELIKTMTEIKHQHSRTLAEESAKHWYEISTQQYMFDRKQREIEGLKHITLEMFMNFYDVLVGIGPARTNLLGEPSPSAPHTGTSPHKPVPSRISVLVQSQTGHKKANATNTTSVIPPAQNTQNASKATAQQTAQTTQTTQTTAAATQQASQRAKAQDRSPVAQHERALHELEAEYNKVRQEMRREGQETAEKAADLKEKSGDEWAYSLLQLQPGEDHAESENPEVDLDTTPAAGQPEVRQGTPVERALAAKVVGETQASASAKTKHVIRKCGDGSAEEVESKNCAEDKPDPAATPKKVIRKCGDGSVEEVESVKCLKASGATAAGSPAPSVKVLAHQGQSKYFAYLGQNKTYNETTVQVAGKSGQHTGMQDKHGVVSVPVDPVKYPVKGRPKHPSPSVPTNPLFAHLPVHPFHDPSCNKGGPRRVYRERKLTLDNIHAFKDAACLFPKRPVHIAPVKPGLTTVMNV